MINKLRMSQVGMVRSPILAAITGGLVLIGVLSWPGAAGAAGGEQGVLRIHGPGSVYAGSGALISMVASPGGSVNFAFEVKNTGADTAQYNLRVFRTTCQGVCGDVATVTAGTLAITKPSGGPNGYFTAPIDAGNLATYTLKVSTPTTAVPDSWNEYAIRLYDTAGNLLDSETPFVIIKDSTGTKAYDEFSNAASQSPVSGDGNGAVVSSPPVAVLGKATFTVKLANDSTAPAAITWQLVEQRGCSADFTVSVKAGKLDVTTAAFNGTYQTPVLAPKASKILTVTVTNTAYALNCTSGAGDLWAGYTNTFSEATYLNVPLTP